MKPQAYPRMRCGLDLKPSWHEAFAAPLHITVGQNTKLTKQIAILPRTLLLILLAAIVTLTVLPFMLTSSSQSTQQSQYIAQLQYEQGNFIRKSSETEALLALRDSQIENMQQELIRNNHDMRGMKQRLAMFDDVLAARKVGGWHILHPKAHWQDENTIAYHLVVVKGENYPRWAKGHLAFSVIGSNGESIALDNKRGKKTLKFDMTTHAFFEGIIPWSKDWQAEMLIISLFDKRGKNNQQIEIPILQRNQPKQLHPTNESKLHLKMSKEAVEITTPADEKTP